MVSKEFELKNVNYRVELVRVVLYCAIFDVLCRCVLSGGGGVVSPLEVVLPWLVPC